MLSSRLFLVRSGFRDTQTDQERLRRLTAVLEALINEIDRERDGLRKRYESATTNAAFLFEAINNEGETASMEKRSVVLTTQIARYESRMQTLSRQKEFYEFLWENLVRFQTTLNSQ